MEREEFQVFSTEQAEPNPAPLFYQLTPNNQPTLLWLQRCYNLVHLRALTAEQVAHEAGVSIGVYFDAEAGGLVSIANAAKILPAFSRLSGLRLAIGDVYMQLNLREDVIESADSDTRENIWPKN